MSAECVDKSRAGKGNIVLTTASFRGYSPPPDAFHV